MPASRPDAWRRAAHVTLAGALTLGACATESDRDPLGGGDDRRTGTSERAGGTTTTTGNPGSRATTTTTTGTPAAAEAPPVPADVRAAFERAIAHMREVDSAELSVELAVEAGAGSQAATMDGEFDAADVGTLDATIRRGGEPVALELRSDGGTAWVRTDASRVAGLLPADARWVEAPVGQLRDAGVFTGIDATFDMLPVLRGVGEATDAGTDEIGGEPVRLLTGPVDWPAALAAASPEEAQFLQQTISFTGDTRPTAFTATVGLDGTGHARRLRLDVTASSDQDPALSQIHLRLGYDAFRLDHDVAVPEPPPAGDTVPAGAVPGILPALADGL